MYPQPEQYQIVIEGMAYRTDLETLKQWTREGRVGPYTMVTRGTGSPMAARETPELREFFQPSRPGPAVAAPPPVRPTVGYGAPMPPYQQPYQQQSYQPSYSPHAGAAAPMVPRPVPVFHVSAHDGPFPNETHRKNPRYRRAVGLVWIGSIPGLILASLFVLLGFWVVFMAADFQVAPGGIDIRVLIVCVSVLFFTLNLGLHFKSRVCAVLLFLWMALAWVGIMVNNPLSLGVIILPILLILYLCALAGTFSYQSFKYEVETGRI